MGMQGKGTFAGSEGAGEEKAGGRGGYTVKVKTSWGTLYR